MPDGQPDSDTAIKFCSCGCAGLRAASPPPTLNEPPLWRRAWRFIVWYWHGEFLPRRFVRRYWRRASTYERQRRRQGA